MTIFNFLQMQQKGTTSMIMNSMYYCIMFFLPILLNDVLFILDRLGSFSQTLHLEALSSFQKLRQLILKFFIKTRWYTCFDFIPVQH